MDLNKLVTALTAYYKSAKISGSGDFNCSEKEKCKKISEQLEPPREADLGPHYGDNIPKLLFLSLDRGWSSDNRTIQRGLSWKPGEQEAARGIEKNQHWYRTCEIAHRVLSQFDPARINKVEVEDMVGYIAHTNSAKCYQPEKNGKQADSALFNNCRKFLKEEVLLFDPDILVTQGNQAKKAIDEHFCGENHSYEEIRFKDLPDLPKKIAKYWIISMGDKKALWFHTYHPRYFGGFNKQRREIICSNVMSKIVKEFYNESKKK